MNPVTSEEQISHTQMEATRATPHPSQRYAIRRLRRLIPNHSEPMNWPEAERVAASQGACVARLAAQANLAAADWVSTLPVIRIESDPTLPDYRTSYWDDTTNQWVIVIRATDPETSQRFSVLHELKRIIDVGYESRLYDPRYLQGHVQAEMAADHFASCALMPPKEVRAAYQAGANAADLARRFGVSPTRATKRLSDLNLLPVIPPSTRTPERRNQ